MSRQTTKIVRFYDPVLLDQNNQETEFKDGLWIKLEGLLAPMPVGKRTVRFNAADYYGFCKVSKAPAARYFKVGRQRTRADQPETVNTSSGSESPLALPPDEKLFEPTFLLPFGTKNRVSVLGQTFSAPRVSAVERWLTMVLGYDTTDKSVRLRPVIDAKLAQKLADSVGVTVLEVAFPRGSQEFSLPGQKRPGTVRSAIEEVAHSTDESGAGTRWSFGHSTPNPRKSQEFLRAARELFQRQSQLETLKVNLQLPLADGSYRTEQIDLLEERITEQATYVVPDDQPVDDSSVLTGMNESIKAFNDKVK